MSIDPKDRQNINPLSAVQGIPEGTPQVLSQTQSSAIENPTRPSPDQLRPPIDPKLAAIGVNHGADTFRLSDSARQVVQTHNPPLRSLPGGLAFTPQEFEKWEKEGAQSGSGWMGAIGGKELEKAA